MVRCIMVLSNPKVTVGDAGRRRVAMFPGDRCVEGFLALLLTLQAGGLESLVNKSLVIPLLNRIKVGFPALHSA